jgi:glycine dehydrogenase
MVDTLGVASLDALIDAVIPSTIRAAKPLELPDVAAPLSESAAIERLASYAADNEVYRSYIGMGYYGTITPPVIARNILENPGWYTQYTPYQPEISQGRLEALLTFQTMITSLTGLPIANASLLDEATAAAEAMSISRAVCKHTADPVFVVSDQCHPQTIAVVRTRADALGLTIVVTDVERYVPSGRECGVLVQYPSTWGSIDDYRAVIERAKSVGAIVIMATDLLALTLLAAPGELGADIAVGSAQRFGVPLGYGGPHAAFFSCRDELKRLMPGRLVGVTRDAAGRRALRLSLQTREQHIRREKATSNICTAQVLLAIMSGMYAVYHGPSGLRDIASAVHRRASRFAAACLRGGLSLVSEHLFDTVAVKVSGTARDAILARAAAARVNLRSDHPERLAVSLDETVTDADCVALATIFGVELSAGENADTALISEAALRNDHILSFEVFERYHTETEFLRYIKRLEARDLSLANSMIPLGSCTMKLNATTEMLPVTWPSFASIHPYAPRDQVKGYHQLFAELESSLAAITGFSRVSLQPNAGSQGEYAGLLAIRGYLAERGETERTICLIPRSAHGTNPASAVMVGFTVVPVGCDEAGNIDIEDVRRKIAEHPGKIAAIMITYPSTHGVFEERVTEVTRLVHEVGGQVYMDGANLNALVGLVRPVDLGMDVCHINLHKTFCIPHGGGGPGMGPIAVREHLAPFLPGDPLAAEASPVGPVSAAPYGSASILPISWAYIAMMGAEGLTHATKVAILSANYIARRLRDAYPVVFTGDGGYVAHECIIDLRPMKEAAGIEVDDVAKRLMDYGFHAPTVSWPVPGTMMIEPTESESLAELDRFCDAMLSIAEEIRFIATGEFDRTNNPLKHAPHTAVDVTGAEWTRPYARQLGAFPVAALREGKFWPSVGRVDAAFGDRNLVCSCPPMEE